MVDELLAQLKMSRNVSGLVQLLLMALMLVGVWLASSRDSTLLIGLLLGLGAAAGLIVLARRENSLPLDQDERAAWEIIRAKGKRLFVLKAVMKGFILGLIFLVYQLIHSRWTGSELSILFGIDLTSFGC